MSMSQNRIVYEEILVTPELAREYLKSNKVNRIWKKRISERYARDMKAGNWDMTGECIMFDKNGYLSNGQHRLNAIIMADVPVLLGVMRGVDITANIDVGYKRSDAANLQIKYNDTEYTDKVRAVVIMLSSLTKSLNRPTTEEQWKIYNYYKDAIQYVNTIEGAAKVFAPMKTAGVIAIHKFNMDKHKVGRFITVFNNGFQNDESDNQAIALRNHFLNNRDTINCGGSNRSQFVHQALSCLLAYHNGRIAKRIACCRELNLSEDNLQL